MDPTAWICLNSMDHVFCDSLCIFSKILSERGRSELVFIDLNKVSESANCKHLDYKVEAVEITERANNLVNTVFKKRIFIFIVRWCATYLSLGVL